MGCCNSAVVGAPVDQVWGTLRNFHDMSWCSAVVEKLDVVGDAAGDQIGAGRVLNDAFHETLIALDNDARVIRYTIDDGPEAVSKDNVQDFIGEVRVFPVTENDSTFVLWTASWDSSGGGVAEFCDPIYQALLGALKEHFA